MRRLVLQVGLVLAGCVAISAALFPDDPPPAHTGGFGEPTCLVCHFDNELDDGEAIFEIRGLAEVVGGRSYDVELILVREEMLRAGFQLSVRDGDGADAGLLEPIDPSTTTSSGRGITYLQQTIDGAAVEGDSTIWRFRWTAPDDLGEAVFHAAGNAANGDESQFGDFVYTLERRITAD